MLLKKVYKDNGWMLADYQATWQYGYDFMLDAAQTVIDTDLKDDLQRVAVGRIAGAGQEECIDDVRAAGNILRNCPKAAEENGVLIVSGISRIMGVPVQLMFYDQTNIIRLCTPDKSIFKKHGKNAFTTYMSSMEINAYCTAAERRVRKQLTDSSEEK
ncbi:MAG: hypothetical protein ACI4J5_02115 [Oscillospiraceae bacterium]